MSGPVVKGSHVFRAFRDRDSIRRNLDIPAALCVIVALAWLSVYARADGPPTALRRSVNCGPNAVFMFLVLCGVTPTHESVASIDCGIAGASFADLLTFSKNYGIQSEVRHYTPSEFSSMLLPAICQTRGSSATDVTHFIVAYDVSSTGIRALDSTTGRYIHVRADRIADYLSGYALVRKHSLLIDAADRHSWLFISLLTANVMLLSRAWRSTSPPCAFACRSAVRAGEQ